MLDEGLAAGLRYLGLDSRCIGYAEREAYACGVLEARMEEGSLAPAPIWCGDFTKLPARSLRGMVDCIVAGFPCQDISLAGRRAGLDGARSGLFFNILDIADDSQARYLFLENVAGIASATATVVDEAEGELLERAAARVMGELADRGWDAEWITLSASDVGASHGRTRWFCWAWRQELDDTASPRRDGARQRSAAYSSSGQCLPGSGCADVAHAGGHGGHGPYRESGSGRGVCKAGNPVAHAERAERRQERTGSIGSLEGHDGGRREADGGAGIAGSLLVNTSSPRPQRPELGTTRNSHRGGQETHGSTSQLCGLFAPGPSDPRWAGILAAEPWLAPALDKETESVLRGTPDGLASGLDFDNRAARLRCVGNGVVAAQAGFAAVVLLRQAGFMSMAQTAQAATVAELVAA